MPDLNIYWQYFMHHPLQFLYYLFSSLIGFFIVGLVLFLLIARSIYKRIVRSEQPVSSDGHRIKPSENNTVQTPKHPIVKSRYANRQDPLPQYIVHEEPEEGYIILNGKKISKKDLKYK